jgi:hypothetical protein
MSVKSKVTEGLLAEAARWNLSLTRPSAEAIADEISVPDAIILRSGRPWEKAAAEQDHAEKREILREATANAIARTMDPDLKADLQQLLADVDQIDTTA